MLQFLFSISHTFSSAAPRRQKQRIIITITVLLKRDVESLGFIYKNDAAVY